MNETPPSLPNYIFTKKKFKAASSQIRSLYRYGQMAECSSHWSDFKFCLSLRALSAEERRVAWIRHRAEWWATRRTMGSSEDVWEIRKYVRLFILSRHVGSPSSISYSSFIVPLLLTPFLTPCQSCFDKTLDNGIDWSFSSFFLFKNREPLKNFPPPPSQIKDDEIIVGVQSNR